MPVTKTDIEVIHAVMYAALKQCDKVKHQPVFAHDLISQGSSKDFDIDIRSAVHEKSSHVGDGILHYYTQEACVSVAVEIPYLPNPRARVRRAVVSLTVKPHSGETSHSVAKRLHAKMGESLKEAADALRPATKRVQLAGKLPPKSKTFISLPDLLDAVYGHLTWERDRMDPRYFHTKFDGAALSVNSAGPGHGFCAYSGMLMNPRKSPQCMVYDEAAYRGSNEMSAPELIRCVNESLEETHKLATLLVNSLDRIVAAHAQSDISNTVPSSPRAKAKL